MCVHGEAGWPGFIYDMLDAVAQPQKSSGDRRPFGRTGVACDLTTLRRETCDRIGLLVEVQPDSDRLILDGFDQAGEAVCFLQHAGIFSV